MLRLEHLFDRLGQLIPRTEALDHHYAIATIFEIMDVASRADLKSDLLKELERHKSLLNSYRGMPNIAEEVLDQVVSRLDRAYDGLVRINGKAGQVLAANDWLMSIRSRINIPGGTCEFDLPAYFAWQHKVPALRQADIQGWTASLTPLAEALQLLLALIRDSGHPQMVAAPNGQYQQSLPQNRSYHLLRLRLDENLGLIPEITGHRLMVSIRLMRQDDDGRTRACSEDASFELTLCAA